jgi:hypothetical protein
VLVEDIRGKQMIRILRVHAEERCTRRTSSAYGRALQASGRQAAERFLAIWNSEA